MKDCSDVGLKTVSIKSSGQFWLSKGQLHSKGLGSVLIKCRESFDLQSCTPAFYP